VEGGRRKGNNRGCYCIGIAQNVRRLNVQDAIPIFIEKAVSHFVPSRSNSIVDLAIYLDRQSRFTTIKVDDVRPDRMLAANLVSAFSTFQPLPQHGFGQAHVAP
jgi:hypothetical protein